MSEVLKTLVVEDDPDHADLLSRELKRLGDLAFRVTHSDSTAQALGKLATDAYDVVFVDYWLGAETSEVVLEHLRNHTPGTPVIVTTSTDDSYIAATVTRAGAHRYLRKQDLHTPMLGQAVRDALRDSRKARRQTAAAARAQARLHDLTPREREIAGLIAQGLLSKQIGAKIGCTEGTVNLHRSHIIAKSGAQSVADVVRMVLLAEGADVAST